LAICDTTSAAAPSLATRIVTHLREAGPRRHRDLRGTLRVRDADLSQALRQLEATGHVIRTPEGWTLPAPRRHPSSVSAANSL
jgi:DNA-binding HxlR family transcriptional regulator